MTVRERFERGELIHVWTLGDEPRAWWCDDKRTPIATKAVETILRLGVASKLGVTASGYFVGKP